MNARAATIVDALRDPLLLGAALGDPAPWAAWVAILKAAWALPLDDAERAIFDRLAGGRKPPERRVSELWVIAGRRSGKSRMAAAIATYLAAFEGPAVKLAPGERGHVLALASTLAQANEAHHYVEGFMTASPILARSVEAITATTIKLAGRIEIATHPANFRSVRGRTLVAAIFDEAAYWRDEVSAQPDLEIYRAVLPALATTGGMLVGISSPYRRTGLLHSKHRAAYGVDDPEALVIQAPTGELNPTIKPGVIARARAADPEAASAEWDAQFRTDLAALFSEELIEDAIDHGRPLELPWRRDRRYVAFVDASAGRHDAFTACIGHVEGDVFVADVVRGRKPPFDPASVAKEYAELAKAYGVSTVVGDAFAGEWVSQAFAAWRVRYVRSALPKSALYLEALPAFAQGRVRIPDHAPLLRELRTLERRVGRMGKDTVDHPRGGSDDLANALAGALNVAQSSRYRPQIAAVAPMRGLL